MFSAIFRENRRFSRRIQVIESIELPEVLGLIAKPHYVLGTTYTLNRQAIEPTALNVLNSASNCLARSLCLFCGAAWINKKIAGLRKRLAALQVRKTKMEKAISK